MIGLVSWASSVLNGELINNIEILDHIGKLFKANFAVEVLVRLDDGAVN